jgi:hypothetical protein
VPQLTPTTVWRITPALVRALDDRLGPPLDRYVNGTQTWLTPDGPGEATLEWRLHPVAGFQPPGGIGHEDLWETVLDGDGIDPARCWDGLECFPAYGDELEPATLTRCVSDALGIAPDAAGIVDHDRIGRAWERARGDLSLVDALLGELTATPDDGTAGGAT